MIKQRQEAFDSMSKGAAKTLPSRKRTKSSSSSSSCRRRWTSRAFQEAVTAAIGELEAKTLKDMGRVMALLKERYAGLDGPG